MQQKKLLKRVLEHPQEGKVDLVWRIAECPLGRCIRMQGFLEFRDDVIAVADGSDGGPQRHLKPPTHEGYFLYNNFPVKLVRRLGLPAIGAV